MLAAGAKIETARSQSAAGMCKAPPRPSWKIPCSSKLCWANAARSQPPAESLPAHTSPVPAALLKSSHRNEQKGQMNRTACESCTGTAAVRKEERQYGRKKGSTEGRKKV